MKTLAGKTNREIRHLLFQVNTIAADALRHQLFDLDQDILATDETIAKAMTILPQPLVKKTDAEIRQAIVDLVELIRENSDANAVAFELFVNSSEYDATWKFRDSKSLTREGISMRNLAGTFI